MNRSVWQGADLDGREERRAERERQRLESEKGKSEGLYGFWPFPASDQIMDEFRQMMILAEAQLMIRLCKMGIPNEGMAHEEAQGPGKQDAPRPEAEA
jgi:hypothetical protein